MIYLDASVVLAELLDEERHPPPALWNEELTSSRLLEYEVWNRLNARGLEKAYGDDARNLLNRVGFLELEHPVLERALSPFPRPVHTLDGLHLASAEFIRRQGGRIILATYDERMRTAAKAMKIPLATL